MRKLAALPALDHQEEAKSVAAMPEAKYLKFASLPQYFKEKGLDVSYDDLYAFVVRHNRRKRGKHIARFYLPDRSGLHVTKEDADLILDMYTNPDKYIEQI